MRLLLFHPGVAAISCDACQKMMHDMRTGKPEIRYRGPKREPYNLTAANTGYRAPCFTKGYKCPKESPDKERDHVLSPRNYRTLLLYQQARATGFQFMPDLDEITADNFAVIDQLMRDYENTENAKTTIDGFGQLLAAARKQ